MCRACRTRDRLEARGLVERRPDPGDRRKTWVHARPVEHEHIGAAYDEILRQMGEVHARYSVAELQTVLRYLDDAHAINTDAQAWPAKSPTPSARRSTRSTPPAPTTRPSPTPT